jgi:hypothetical protein
MNLKRRLKSRGIELIVTDFNESFSQNEDGKIFNYPETIEVTINNWSTSHYSVRTKDNCWVRSGQNLNRTNVVNVAKIYQMHLKENKAFEAHKAKLKRAQ